MPPQPSYQGGVYAPNSQTKQPWRADLNTLISTHPHPTNNHLKNPALQHPRTPSPAPHPCYGRVADLEAMVPPQWWTSVFADSMYLKTDGDVVEDPDITREEVAMLEAVDEIKGILMRGYYDGKDGRDGEEEENGSDGGSLQDLVYTPSSRKKHTTFASAKADGGAGVKPHAQIQSGFTTHQTYEAWIKHRAFEAFSDYHRTTHIDILVFAFSEPDLPAKILDLCCGQGRHTLHLAKEYPHLILKGHDQSSYLISLAQERAEMQDLATQTTFTVGDCRQIPYPDNTFDLVLLMGNSFGYFSTDDGDRHVLSEVSRVLAPGGRLVLDLTDGNYMRANFAERSWEWIDDTTFVCRERQLSKDGLRLNSREVVTVTTKGVVRDQFYQERLYGRGELDQVIREAGLQVVVAGEKDGEIKVGKEMSKRKEDLGMMEQRMLVMAVKPVPRDDDDLSSSSAGCESLESGSASNGASSSGSVGVGGEVKVNGVNGVNGVGHHHHHGANGVVVANGVNGHHSDDHHTNGVAVNRVATPASLFDDDAPAPFTSMVVLMGDPSKPCIGKLNNTWNEEDFLTRENLLTALYELGYTKDAITVLDSHEDFHRILSENPPPFVFNLCDEGFQNDALKELHVPAILDMLQIPYSGAGPACLAYCYDKGLVNRTAQALGVPTPRETFFFADASDEHLSDIAHLHTTVAETVKYPAFIKPVKGDNSLGITSRSIVRTPQDLDSYMSELASIGIRDVIIQEYLPGTEYSLGMIGNLKAGFHFFPVLEVDYTRIVRRGLDPILGFESKWDPRSPYWSEVGFRRAKLTEEVETELRRRCVVLWERFGCRDYARFDFRASGPTASSASALPEGDGTEPTQNGTQQDATDQDATHQSASIKLLEVNPNPGWCWDGKLAYMGKLEGKAYREVVGMVLRAAWERVCA
ncbi:hypothetical protein HK104_010460 [Borealophlyctis nickersoniae]|nr:hypothetical protein HK104_010460 [Borealophlyctis nickersoniae]